jgi:CHAD domain-containing protein
MSATRMTVTELALTAFASARGDFVRASRASFAGGSEQSVHRARVALRKLRVYVRLFRSRVGRRRAAQLNAELRWLFRQLGTLRDLQVFTHSHLRRAPAVSKGLKAHLTQRTRAAHDALRASAQGPRFDALMRDLEQIEVELRAGGDTKSARRWLARRLEREHERITAMQPRVVARGGSALHALRKRVKRLRYELELWHALDGRNEQRTRRFALSLVAVQDLLGAWNDLRSARTLARALEIPPALRATMVFESEAVSAAHLAGLPNALAILAAAKGPWR